MPRCKGWLRKLRGEEKLKRAPTEAGSLQVGDVHRLRACVRLGLLALFLVDRVRLAAAAALRLSLHLSTGRWLVGRRLGGATGDATVRLRLEQLVNSEFSEVWARMVMLGEALSVRRVVASACP